MKILPEVKKMCAAIDNNKVKLKINENFILQYKNSTGADDYILQDLIEKHAYATTLLYLNENYELDNNYDKNSLLEDIDELLHKNITIVEAQGPELVNIKGYPIYEYEDGVLRGAGKKKILENFGIDKMYMDYLSLDAILDELIAHNATDTELNDFLEEIAENEIINAREYSTLVRKAQDTRKIEEAAPLDTSGSRPGTQTSDIAPKVDQELNKEDKKTKKLEDVLTSGIEENEDLLNKGFFKNRDGQYERNNFILVKEGNKYLAIHKNKLDEYAVRDNGDIEVNTPASEVTEMKEYFSSDPRFNSLFNIKTVNTEGIGAIAFTRKNKKIDLITLSDLIIKGMQGKGYENGKDFEIDYRGDTFLLVIKNVPQINL